MRIIVLSCTEIPNIDDHVYPLVTKASEKLDVPETAIMPVAYYRFRLSNGMNAPIEVDVLSFDCRSGLYAITNRELSVSHKVALANYTGRYII